jgi:protein-tyrosine phosphatase
VTDDTGRAASPLSGAFNFRDLGGMPTVDGGRTRAGLLFRSDTLQALTEEDVRVLTHDFGVQMVVDLRSGSEAVEQGRGPLADQSVCYVNIPLRDLAVEDGRDPGDQTLGFYLAHLGAPTPQLTMTVEILAATAGRPTVLHCAAGKDRTGLVTAMVLRLVGVEDDAVVADYMETAKNMPRIVSRLRDWPRYSRHMDTVPAAVYRAEEHTIRGFLRALDEEYGGARAWAAARGVAPGAVDRLRDAMVERPA